MELIDLIESAHGGNGLSSVGRQFGLDEAQTKAAIEQLAPVVAAGVRRNIGDNNGMVSLLEAMQRGNHGRFLDEPDAVQYDHVANEGNAMLGHIFGSKDVSRGVAMHAAGQTGIGGAILKKLLPVIASMVLGGLAKKMGGGAPQPRGGGGLGDILGDVLGGGREEPAPQPRGGGGLGDILGDIMGGGQSRGRQQPDMRPGPPGSGLDDLLRDILGGGPRRGGSGPRGGSDDVMPTDLGGEEADMSYEGGETYDDDQPYNDDAIRNGRDYMDDILGRGSSSGNAADDLLSSVERHLGRR